MPVPQGRGPGSGGKGSGPPWQGRTLCPPLAGSFLPADHRQSSHHIHHPLSTHLPPDTRRRKTPQGPGRKPRRRPGASPTGETPTIEEGEEDEDEASEAEGSRALTQPSPASTPSSVQVSWGRAPEGGEVSLWGPLASLAPVGSCSSSFCRRMKVLTERQKGPVHLLPHQCPTRRRLPGPAEGPRLGRCPQIETSPTAVSDVMWGKKHEPQEPQIRVQIRALPLWASITSLSLLLCKPRIIELSYKVVAGIKGWCEIRFQHGLLQHGTGVQSKPLHFLPHL